MAQFLRREGSPAPEDPPGIPDDVRPRGRERGREERIPQRRQLEQPGGDRGAL